MKSSIEVVIFILILSFATVYTKDCEDLQDWCASVSASFCNDSADMRTFCPAKCDSCLPLECNQCEHNCKVSDIGKYCTCQNGFRLQPDNRSCVDINECSEYVDICGEGSVCKNEVGDYSCFKQCTSGFRQSHSYPSRCCKETKGMCGIRTSLWWSMPFEPSKINWPWQVVLLRSYYCEGTLLNKLWVVSAAHCFEKASNPLIEKIPVYLGVRDLADLSSRTVVERRVKQIIRHEKYDFPLNDIAVFRMNKPVTYGRYINPICLPNGEIPPTGTKCFATEYTFTENASMKLRQAEAMITNGTICKKAYEWGEINVDRIICADLAGAGYIGGPLMCQRCDMCEWYLAGIFSLGSIGESPYRVYSKVEFFEEWIASKIKAINVKKEACYPIQWKNWGDWSQCTKSCDSGSQSRRRVCQNGKVGESGCIGEEVQTLQCNEQQCEEDSPPNV